MTTEPLRCAIYTRKSSEEGLDQSFNSLHAQREACEAYIKSQALEGWSCLAAAYDDGGYSGGSMDRPALQALLADIARGRVDVVVVYKVDRLTRSLADFAKIVEAFDARGVSFVSVTQSFNTTSSMGRLTLNMLLSFAQYERELTSERIRDKIAASKAKGMWMGGNLPLGYDAGDHTLIVNEPEAEQVRHIFRRYLELKSVHLLQSELEREGHCSKRWTSRKGRAMGGLVLSRGALFHILQNRHYRGEIVHKDRTYPSTHKPIVDEALFAAAQAQLAASRVRQNGGASVRPGARLKGRLFDADGDPMSPTHAYGHRGKAYRYYVSTPLLTGERHSDVEVSRLPADGLEAFVLDWLRRTADRPAAKWESLSPSLIKLEVRAESAHVIIDAALAGEPRELAKETIAQRLGHRVFEEPGGASLRVVLPFRLSFRGGRTWVTDADGAPTHRVGRQDAALSKALKSAHAILKRQGADLAALDQLDIGSAPASDYERRLCAIAFLAPDIQRQILEGRHPADVGLSTLLAADIPLNWDEQRRWFASAARGSAKLERHGKSAVKSSRGRPPRSRPSEHKLLNNKKEPRFPI